jgi:hypothetical protein
MSPDVKLSQDVPTPVATTPYENQFGANTAARLR